MKNFWLLLLFSLPAFAQSPVIGGAVQYVPTAPSGSCSQAPPIDVLNANGHPWTCANGTWTDQGGGGGGGAVNSVANSDGTLTISPTTGSIVASIALGHANTWTSTQTFPIISLPITSATTGFIEQPITGGGQTLLLHTFTAGGTASDGNLFVGQGAGNTTATAGISNTGVGTSALIALTTGQVNTAVGTHSMLTMASGTQNTAVGVDSLHNDASGGSNVALGVSSLYFSTSGPNTAVGFQAQQQNITGVDDVAVGWNALNLNTAGNNNVGVGDDSLFATTGGNNTGIGYQAGYTATSGNANTSGAGNTWVGYQSGPGTATQLTNSCSLGFQALTTTSNTCVIGNGSVTDVYFGSASAAANIHAATINSLPVPVPAFTSLTTTCTGAQTWAIGSAWIANASITITGSCTLNLTGPLAGGNYVLVVTQGSGGAHTLALGTGCTWKVSGGGSGAITPTTGAGAIDVLSFTYDGTNCYANYNKNFS